MNQPDLAVYLGNAVTFADCLQVIHTLLNDVIKEQPSIDHADHVLQRVMFPEFFTRGPVVGCRKCIDRVLTYFTSVFYSGHGRLPILAD